jgi:hypothetical protein
MMVSEVVMNVMESLPPERVMMLEMGNQKLVEGETILEGEFGKQRSDENLP